MSFLDDFPVATVQFLAGVVLIIIAYLSNDISILTAFEALGLNGGAALGIGHVRNGAGKGLRVGK